MLNWNFNTETKSEPTNQPQRAGSAGYCCNGMTKTDRNCSIDWAFNTLSQYFTVQMTQPTASDQYKYQSMKLQVAYDIMFGCAQWL